MVARRDWTRRWFDSALIGTDELVTSPATLAELQSGDYPGKADALKLFDALPLLSLDTAVIDIVDAYLARKLMPQAPEGDALHLAVASCHRCDFLVTWNPLFTWRHRLDWRPFEAKGCGFQRLADRNRRRKAVRQKAGEKPEVGSSKFESR